MSDFDKLLSQVETMLKASGDSAQDFDAAAWLIVWLDQPVPALNDQKPSDVLATPEGYSKVSKVLSCIQYGAYL